MRRYKETIKRLLDTKKPQIPKGNEVHSSILTPSLKTRLYKLTIKD